MRLILFGICATLLPALSLGQAPADRGRELVTKLEKRADGGAHVVFANGARLEEKRGDQRVAVVFPGGQSRILKGISLTVHDAALELGSLEAAAQGVAFCGKQIIFRRPADTAMVLFCRDSGNRPQVFEIRLNGDVFARLVNGDLPFGDKGGVSERVELAEGGFKAKSGAVYRPLLPKEWVLAANPLQNDSWPGQPTKLNINEESFRRWEKFLP